MADKTETATWTRFEPDNFDAPTNLEGADQCYYARERISHGGFNACKTNDLISNFKIPSSAGTASRRWRYKVGAVNQFADELARFIPPNFAIAAVPSSKSRSDPEFDPRFDMLFDRLAEIRKDLVPCEPVARRISVAAVHTMDERPSVETILQTIEYAGFDNDLADGDHAPPHLVFLDDVVTTGRQFSACRRLVLANAPATTVYGVFWARTIWRDPVVDLSAISPLS